MLLTAKIDKPVLTIPEAAKACGVTRMTMWRWVRSNKIRHIKTPGGHHRINRSELIEFINRCSAGEEESQLNGKPKILAVDDDTRIQKYLYKLLTGHGYAVKTCSDGFEAGIWVMKFQPQILILDLYMPNIDGFNACKTIKSDPDTSGLKIIAVSGHPTKTNIQRILAAGANIFIAKPLDREVLLNHIDDMLPHQIEQRPAQLKEA